MSNGCICCTMRADLLREVTRLARAGRFDYLLVESTGVSEPMQARLSLLWLVSIASHILSTYGQIDCRRLDSLAKARVEVETFRRTRLDGLCKPRPRTAREP
jgi:G3E family GTPase